MILKEETIYDITVRKEVLNEYAADIIADFVRYFIENNISSEEENSSDLLVKLYWKVVRLKKSLINEDTTMEDLNKAEEILKFVNSMF